MGGIIAAIPGATAQGLVWGVMALGVYVTYKLLDIADLTGGQQPLHQRRDKRRADFDGNAPAAFSGFRGICRHACRTCNRLFAHASAHPGHSCGNTHTTGALLHQSAHHGQIQRGASAPAGGHQPGKHPMALLIGVLVAAAVVAVMYWFFGTNLAAPSAQRATTAKWYAPRV